MRKVSLFNDNWRFCKENVGPDAAVAAGELLNLPHTWNALDCDGGSGICVTPMMEGSIAHVQVKTEVEGSGTVCVSLYDAEGNPVGGAEGLDVSIDIANAHLWHGRKHPYLYCAKPKK